jgi:hypothetical protein
MTGVQEDLWINKVYNSDMWAVSHNAMSGVNGIYTHVSYRLDKADCVPQFNLIEMLKNLNIIFSTVTSLGLSGLCVDWAHKCNKFIWNDPI